MPKKFDPRAKARKQKIVAAVLTVVLLGVLVYQAPTILGIFGGGSSTTESEPAPATPVVPVGAPAAPATPAPAAGASAELVDSDVAPTPATGQLVAFDRFESKDPFAQQLAENDGTNSQPAPDEKVEPSKNETKSTAQPKPQPSAQPVAAKAPSPAKSAEISVNGKTSTVTLGGTFMPIDPVFRLTALTSRSAKVGIVGGTYASGSQTITLEAGGKPVTLMNTGDGTTYVLRLLSVG
jgi:hypothetical protein